MKTISAKLKNKNELTMVERELNLKENEVLVETFQSSICDADLRAFRGLNMPDDLPPFVYLGHEGGGKVVKKGNKVREFEINDNVMLFGPHSSFANYFKAPVEDLHKVPEGLDMKIASLAEPITVGMYAVTETDVQLGDVCAVVGLNFQGLIAVQALKRRGANKVIAIDYSQKHLEIAKKLGADITIRTNKEDAYSKVKDITNEELCDVVFHSCGYWNTRAEEYFNLGRDITRDEGTMVSVPDMMSPLKTSFHRFHHHAIKLKFPALMHHSPAFRQIWVPRLLKMFVNGGLTIDPLITGTYTIENTVKAMEDFHNDEDHVKIILKPNQL